MVYRDSENKDQKTNAGGRNILQNTGRHEQNNAGAGKTEVGNWIAKESKWNAKEPEWNAKETNAKSSCWIWCGDIEEIAGQLKTKSVTWNYLRINDDKFSS